MHTVLFHPFSSNQKDTAFNWSSRSTEIKWCNFSPYFYPSLISILLFQRRSLKKLFKNYHFSHFINIDLALKLVLTVILKICVTALQQQLSWLSISFWVLLLQLSAIQQAYGTFFLMLSLHRLLSSAVLFRTSELLFSQRLSSICNINPSLLRFAIRLQVIFKVHIKHFD